jgi:radical SAM protein with 4Fe4S-binding SPASM domain
MCHFSNEQYYKRRRAEMSVDAFSALAEQVFPLCHQACLSWSTEPLLHWRFGDILDITRQYDIPYVHMNTNGLFLNEDLIDRMLHTLHGIGISIDGATEQTYKHIRVGGNFKKLIANLKAFSDARRRRGSATPTIGLGFVLMRSNIEDLPALVELAANLAIDAVNTQHLVPYQITNTRDESLVNHKELYNRMAGEARARAEKLGVVLVLPDAFAEGPGGGSTVQLGTTKVESKRHKTQRNPFAAALRMKDAKRSCCPFPWHFVAIDCHGSVMPCGWWSDQHPLGNINTESFERLWNNERFRTLRAEHLMGTLRDCCRNCPVKAWDDPNDPSPFGEKQ